MPLNHYERKLYELLKGLTEADKFYARNPDGEKISVFTDKDNYQDAIKSGGYDPVDREEAEAELSGQTGEKPAEKPEPKAAEPAEKPKPKMTKIAADPFADKGGEEPAASAEKQPQAGPDLGEKDAQAFQQASQDPEWVEKYNKALKNDFDYYVEELKDNPDYADYLKDSEEQKRTEALPGWNDKKKGFLKNKTWSSQIAAEIAAKQAVLRGDSQPSLLPDPTGEPTSGPDTSKTYSSPEEGIEQNTEELADLFNQRIENPEDIDVANEMDSILMDIFQDDSLVTAITETPPEDFKNAQQYIDSLKDAAREMGESKQPFREQYNRLFESLGRI